MLMLCWAFDSKRNLGHVLAGECELKDAIVEGPHGIRIIPATSGTQSMTELISCTACGFDSSFW